jgi:Protein of unknown function (DUF2892)
MHAAMTERRPQPLEHTEEDPVQAAMTEPHPRLKPLENGLSLSYEAAGASWGNLSGAERVLRVLVGAAMLAGGWTGAVTGLGGVALQVFGWVPLITGVAGWCPFYAVLGFSSRRRRTPAADPGERSPGHRSGDQKR